MGCFQNERHTASWIGWNLAINWVKPLVKLSYETTCHSFSAKWSLYYSGCESIGWNWYYHVPNYTTRYPSLITSSCLLSSPILSEPSSLVLFPVANFFDGSPTQGWFCFTSSKCSIIIWAHLCSCVGLRVDVWLLICPTTFAFHLFLTNFIRALCTHLGLSHLMVVHLSRCQCDHTIEGLNTHLFWYPYGSENIVVHDTPWNTIATIILKSEAHVKRDISHFSPHHSQQTMSGYPYHQRWLLNFDGHRHCWLDLHIYDASNINNNNTCNDDGYIRENMIIHWTMTRQWFHYPCYCDVWVFPFSFWFILKACVQTIIAHHQWSFLIPSYACFLLLTTRIHSHVTCANHIDFSTSCCIWSRILISSTHNN